MNVAILKETLPGENRVAAIPATVKEMVKSGMKVLVESGAGENSHISNDEYKNAGAEIVSDRANLLANTDLILKVAPAELDEI
ncbi:MAG: NAD(P)(+) transhydrogenase (Re/Si-specific) subunit alpha, partial [Candidatus Marinimicrobia bacterium]|nr:NAD(P)(+) transhydrogenase (Re/Si-specific) subunit alpha [Candidatus Neomarinimicrobiota bacterium]